jgi:hypothetical protein
MEVWVGNQWPSPACKQRWTIGKMSRLAAAGWDPTTPVNIIIDTDGSVTFGVGYHSWVISTEDEDILIQGGGPDDVDLFLMQSYMSELGGWQQALQS